MAVNLLEFLYDTNDQFAEKADKLVKKWRVGIASCLEETDLIVYSMYSKFLSTDLSDYASITTQEVINVMNSIVNIFNITNVTINSGDVINYITNTTVNNIYSTTVIYQAPSYSTTYSIADAGDITINHGLNKFNPTVTVTDTATGSRIRVEVGITEITANQIVLSFSSASSGDITIM